MQDSALSVRKHCLPGIIRCIRWAGESRGVSVYPNYPLVALTKRQVEVLYSNTMARFVPKCFFGSKKILLIEVNG